MGKVLIEWSDEYDYYHAVTPYAANVTRTWVRNDIGTASVTFPLTTPNLSNLVAWGHIIRIHEDGLQSWAGTVEGREWTESGVTLQLKSAEWLLVKKITGQGLFLAPGTTSGKIAYALFLSGYYNNNYVHALKVGIFDGSKPHFKEPYNYAECWPELKKLADEDGADVWVDSDLYCHFRDARGSDKSATIKLREGRHLVNVRVSESLSDTITSAVALGAGSDIASRPKIATMWNAEPPYFRSEVLDFSNIADSSGLREPTLQAIRDRALPKTTIDAEFIRVPSGEFWGAFFIGDIIEILLYGYAGGTNKTRVVGMEKGEDDRIRLVLEVIPQAYDFHFIMWTPTNPAI